MPESQGEIRNPRRRLYYDRPRTIGIDNFARKDGMDGAIVSNFINSRCRPIYAGTKRNRSSFLVRFVRFGRKDRASNRSMEKQKTGKGIFRRREKKKETAMTLSKRQTGRARGEPRNGASERKTKRNERKGGRMGTKMRDNRLQTTRSVNNTKADCGRG